MSCFGRVILDLIPILKTVRASFKISNKFSAHRVPAILNQINLKYLEQRAFFVVKSVQEQELHIECTPSFHRMVLLKRRPCDKDEHTSSI